MRYSARNGARRAGRKFRNGPGAVRSCGRGSARERARARCAVGRAIAQRDGNGSGREFRASCEEVVPVWESSDQRGRWGPARRGLTAARGAGLRESDSMRREPDPASPIRSAAASHLAIGRFKNSARTVALSPGYVGEGGQPGSFSCVRDGTSGHGAAGKCRKCRRSSKVQNEPTGESAKRTHRKVQNEPTGDFLRATLCEV